MNNLLRVIFALCCLVFVTEASVARIPEKPNRSHGKSLPMVHVRPGIARSFVPPKSMAAKKAEEIAFYKQCMYGETELDRTTYVLALNAKWRRNPSLKGAPEKIGYEVCLADALGLSRYENQAEIDAAKGTELMRVSTEFISFPSDKDNVVPFDRQFARPWAKDYIENFARMLHEHLTKVAAEGKGDTDIQLLRMGSLVRSIEGQKKLHSTANCKTEICSTHPAGATIDISTNPKFVQEIAVEWIMKQLMLDRQQGKVLVIREKSHFHLFVVPPDFVE